MTNFNKNDKANLHENGLFTKIKSSFKSVFSSRIAIAIIFAIIGIYATLFTQSAAHEKADYFFDEIGGNNSVFKEMEEMEKRMNKVFIGHRKAIEEAFKKSEKSHIQNTNAQISSHEDEENYYYELNFSGFKKEEIKVLIKDNILTFSAQQKWNNEKKNQENYSSSDFYYSISVPKYDVKKEPEIIRAEDKIVVKLFKIKK